MAIAVAPFRLTGALRPSGTALIPVAIVRAGEGAVMTGLCAALILEGTVPTGVGITAMASGTVQPEIGGAVIHSGMEVLLEEAYFRAFIGSIAVALRAGM